MSTLDSCSSCVLIGSCGGLTGVYLAKRLRECRTLEVLGADCSLQNPAKFFIPTILKVPRASHSLFVDSLCETLLREGIDCYIPTHSVETRVVSMNESLIRERCPDVSFMVSPFQTYEALDDKIRMVQELSRHGIPAPRYIRPEDVVHEAHPVFAKRVVGSGSNGARVLKDGKRAQEAALDPETALFEYIKGDEFTIDCMFDDEGHLISYNQRRRIKTLGGAVVITKNDFSVDCMPWLKKFEKAWVFKGCVNFQCIVKDGDPYFIDVNLRYPSGGLPLSVESGMDVPAMVMKILLHIPFDPQRYQSDRRDRTMYRVFEEMYEVVQ